MLSEMKATAHPIILTQRGAASAVVHDYRAHQRLQNALLMLKLMVQGRPMSQGRTIPQEQMFGGPRGARDNHYGWLISRSCGQARRDPTANESSSSLPRRIRRTLLPRSRDWNGVARPSPHCRNAAASFPR